MSNVERLNPRRRRIVRKTSAVARFFRRNRRRLRYVPTFVAYALLAIAGWGFSGKVRVALPGEEFSGTVTRVVDGDTFHVHGAAAPIRLWGVDAPEMTESLGAASKHLLERIIGAQVVYCKQMDRDRYQRIVARCLTATGDDVSELMVRSGAAKEYVAFTGGFYAQHILFGTTDIQVQSIP
jgi:endonuclease YncB( thermonuclease family)